MQVLFLIVSVCAQHVIQTFSELKLENTSTHQVSCCSLMNFDYVVLNTNSSTLTINYSIPPHYQIDLFYDALLFGNWQGDTYKIYLDDSQMSELAYQWTDFQSGKFCSMNTPNYIQTQKISAYHNSDQLSLKIQLVENALFKEIPLVLGLRNIQINVSICHRTCSTCSGPLDTDCRTCPIDAFKSRRTNRCICSKHKEFMDENACVTLCPRGKSPDSSGFCTPIPNFQLYKESLTSSFNLEDWTMIGVNERKMTYQAKPMIGMFKEMERARLTFGQLPAHSGVVVRFTIFAFNIWAQGEFIKAIIGTVHQTPSVKTISGFSNAYDNANCSSLEMIYCTSFVGEYQLSHTASYIDIEIMSDTYPKSQAKWGISDFSFDLVLCSLNCLECSGSDTCSKCSGNYFNHKGTCLFQCPIHSVKQGDKCVDFDEQYTKSQYLDYSFKSTNRMIENGQGTNIKNYGFYLNGNRVLGGISNQSSIYFLKEYQNIRPHFQIRFVMQLHLFNVEYKYSGVAIVLKANRYGNVYSEYFVTTTQNKLVETIQINQIVAHNSTYLSVQIIPRYNFNFTKYGISEYMILVDQCYPTCDICHGPLESDCTSWKLEPQFQRNLMKCDDSNYFDFQIEECQQCQNNCQICESETKCLTCKVGYILSGYQCYCDQGYYYDQNTQECKQCSKLCNSCIGPLNTDCVDLQFTRGDCTDGIWKSGEECDDNNQINRDGCSNCKIDLGWSCNNIENQPSICYQCPKNCINCQISTTCLQCQEGYYLDSNVCQLCPRDCSTCLSKRYCLNCQVPTFQPFEGRCPVCEENPGFYLIDTQCISQCGDNILAEDEECDDGNLIDKDGCSKQCKIEKGYNCITGICNPIPQEKIANLNYQNRTTTNTLLLQMNNTSYDCNDMYLDVKLENFQSKDFKAFYTKVNTSQIFECQISFKFYKSVSDHDLIHLFIYKSPRKLRIIQETTQNVDDSDEYTEIIISARKEVYYSEDDTQTAEAILGVQSQFTFGLFILGPTTILLGGFSFFFSILDILAWLNTFYYFNVYYPPNIKIIFENSAWDDISFLEIPQTMNLPTDDYYIESPLRFDEKGVDPLFLNNMLMCFTIIGLCLALFPICRIIIRMIEFVYNNVSPKQKNTINIMKQQPVFQLDESNQDMSQQKIVFSPVIKRKIIKKYPWLIQKIYTEANQYQKSFKAILIKQLNLTYLDLCLASVLQIMYVNKIGYLVIFWNILLACLGFILCLVLILLAFWVSSQSGTLLKNKKFQLDYGSLYESIDIHSSSARLYSSINFVRKILFVIFMVTLYDFPIFQTSMCCAASFLNTMLLIYDNPFESRTDLYQNGVPDACIFGIMLVCVGFAYDDMILKLSGDARTNLGWIMISFIAISIMTQLFFIFKQFYNDIQEKYQAIKNLFQK